MQINQKIDKIKEEKKIKRKVNIERIITLINATTIPCKTRMTDEYVYAPKEVHNQNHKNQKYESNLLYYYTKNLQTFPLLHSLHGYKTEYLNVRDAL